MKPLQFVLSVFLGYGIPVFFSGRGWAGWLGVLLVYTIDMGISRIKYPDSMNTKEVSRSEWMTYVGMLFAFACLLISLLPTVNSNKEFLLYVICCASGYCIWSNLPE